MATVTLLTEEAKKEVHALPAPFELGVASDGPTDRWRTAPGPQNLPWRPQAVSSADGKFKFDISEFDKIRVDVSVYDSWTEAKHGEVVQIEGAFINQSDEIVKQFYLDIQPAASVVQLWNLETTRQGTYEMGAYWYEDAWMGGLHPGAVCYWGAILRGSEFTFKMRPYESA